MNVLDSIKRSLILFYLGFPLILCITLVLLGLGLGNAGLLFLSAGQVFIVPLAVAILHAVTQFLPDFTKMNHSEIGLLVPSASSIDKINVFPSYWISHFTFFSSYVFFNALAIYNSETTSDDANSKITKSRSILIMAFTLFTFLAFIGIRYFVTGTENLIGMLLGIGILGGLGYGWYLASASAGIKTMDIFGITPLFNPTTTTDATTVCVSQKPA